MDMEGASVVIRRILGGVVGAISNSDVSVWSMLRLRLLILLLLVALSVGDASDTSV
jgi:hypothetical protein